MHARIAIKLFIFPLYFTPPPSLSSSSLFDSQLTSLTTQQSRYLAKVRDLSRKRAVLFQVHRRRALGNVLTAQTERDNARQTLEDARAADAELRTKLEEAEKVVETTSEEAATASSELKDCKKKFAAFERQDVKQREKQKGVKAEVKRHKAEVKRQQKRREANETTANEATESLPKLKEKAASMVKAVEIAQKALDDACVIILFCTLCRIGGGCFFFRVSHTPSSTTPRSPRLQPCNPIENARLIKPLSTCPTDHFKGTRRWQERQKGSGRKWKRSTQS